MTLVADASPADAVGALRPLLRERPEVALVLGSGLGDLADELVDSVRIAFSDVPGFVAPGVAGMLE